MTAKLKNIVTELVAWRKTLVRMIGGDKLGEKPTNHKRKRSSLANFITISI